MHDSMALFTDQSMTKEICCNRDMDNGSEVSREFFIIHLCDVSTTIHHKKAKNEMGVAMGSKMGENRNDFFLLA